MRASSAATSPRQTKPTTCTCRARAEDGKGERLQNKVAVVTGAGQGIGQQIAFHLATEGASVVVNDLAKGTPTSSLTRIEAGDAETTAKEILERGEAGNRPLPLCQRF